MSGVRTPSFRRLAAAATVQALERVTQPPVEERIEGAELVDLAVRHRMSPIVLEILARDPACETATRQRLLQRALDLRRLGLMQAVRTAELSRAFAEVGIRHLVLKGSPLALQLYADTSARQSRDIDILIAPETLAPADDGLVARGYRRLRAPRRRAADDPVLRRLLKDETYVRDDERLVVELHWRLHHSAALAPWSFEDLWAARRTVEVAGVATPTMSVAHNLVYLACHGANHFWFRLKWLQDIARLLDRATPGELAAAVEAAGRAGIGAPLAAAVELSAELFGSSRPATVARLAPAREVRAIRDFCRRSLELPPDQSTGGGARRQLQVLRYVLRLRRSWRYRLDVLAAALVSPLDHDRLQFPPHLAGLYYPLRPVLMLARHARRGRR